MKIKDKREIKMYDKNPEIRNIKILLILDICEIIMKLLNSIDMDTSCS